MLYFHAGFAVAAAVVALISTSTVGHVGWALLAAGNAVAFVLALRKKRRIEQQHDA
jgi:hypothetical protein